MRPPFDLAAVDAATDVALAGGHRIFQTHRFAENDGDHVAALLAILNPPHGARVLDAGCGIGEVARLMSEQRPDLSFVLMNVSLYQLSFGPVGEQFFYAHDDCHATLLPDASVDCAMFSSALCQMDAATALAEARRVLKPGGILLVNDLAHPQGSSQEIEDAIAARFLQEGEWVSAVGNAGFLIDDVTSPKADDAHFQAMTKQAGLHAQLAEVVPIVIRAIKPEEVL